MLHLNPFIFFSKNDETRINVFDFNNQEDLGIITYRLRNLSMSYTVNNEFLILIHSPGLRETRRAESTRDITLVSGYIDEPLGVAELAEKY